MQPPKGTSNVISIHAPRVGSDLTTGALPSWAVYFNPRSPCGERPRRGQGLGRGVDISIHAPRVGSDRGHDLHKVRHRAFQSTLPVWGATLETGSSLVCDIFQSTLPVWGATRLVWEHWKQFMGISIHAPRVGSDRTGRPNCPSGEHFNPRSPCGERRRQDQHRPGRQIFQSTLPVWGATGFWKNTANVIPYFNPRSPCGERLRNDDKI